MINLLLDKIQNNPTSSIVITAIVAWVLYRIGIWNTRSNILKAIEAELDTGPQHWLRTDWPESRTTELIADKDFIKRIVFKIETIAIDSAIARGGNLFLNRNLIRALIAFKQSVSNFNQLVDSCNNFISNSEVWNNRKADIEKRALDLYVAIHIKGIGGSNDGHARTAYLSIRKELTKELNSRMMPIIWLFTGINFFRLKEFVCKYL